MCVMQTCFDLLEKGYRVHLAVDATSSRSDVDRRMALHVCCSPMTADVLDSPEQRREPYDNREHCFPDGENQGRFLLQSHLLPRQGEGSSRQFNFLIVYKLTCVLFSKEQV